MPPRKRNRISKSCIRVHLVATLPSVGKVFAKSDTFKEGHAQDRLRETAAYKMLGGLAIPERVEPLPKEKRAVLGAFSDGVLWFRFAGERLGHYDRSAAELAGIWIFLLEQYRAFRQRGILYSDIKYDNVLCDRRARRVHVIDLEGCLAVNESGSYEARSLKSTAFSVAPEHRAALDRRDRNLRAEVTETSLVYQLGILFLAVRTKAVNLPVDRSGIRQKKKLFRDYEQRWPAIIRIVSKCVAQDPKNRYATFEEVWAELEPLRDDSSYRAIFEIWHRLRRPYRRELTRLNAGT